MERRFRPLTLLRAVHCIRESLAPVISKADALDLCAMAIGRVPQRLQQFCKSDFILVEHDFM